jgi:hypothetical protein
MKRHASLVSLSREHHAGLVLAKRIGACTGNATARALMCATVLERFANELLPHFEEEEQNIFPALHGIHDVELQRALADHELLMRLAARIESGDANALGEFGSTLAAHIRFEERELFPLYENLLSAA